MPGKVSLVTDGPEYGLRRNYGTGEWVPQLCESAGGLRDQVSGAEKSVSERNVDSTFSTILPLASDFS